MGDFFFNRSLGGFTPIIDSTGKITGYKTEAGADTVFPFSSSIDGNNIEFYEVCNNARVEAGNNITGTITTDATSFDIIFTCAVYRSSIATGGKITVTGGYNTIETLKESMPSATSITTLFGAYHIEKDADSSLTIQVTNNGADYAQFFTKAIVIR